MWELYEIDHTAWGHAFGPKLLGRFRRRWRAWMYMWWRRGWDDRLWTTHEIKEAGLA